MAYPKPFYHRILNNISWKHRHRIPTGDPSKSVKWIDVSPQLTIYQPHTDDHGQGLRGIASFLVILTHLARAWDYKLFSPRDNADATPRILQLPILRIPWQGRLGVTIFAFLTGYVCALKPIKQARNGDTLASFTSIAKSAFRRPPRLILPATIAMVISWTMAQCGAFTAANRSDSWWCRYASPVPLKTFREEVIRLFTSFLSAWTNGNMVYDDHQWALLPLLQASMLVYILLIATTYVQFRWRVVIYVGMYLYFHQDSTRNTGESHYSLSYSVLTHGFRNIPDAGNLRHAAQ